MTGFALHTQRGVHTHFKVMHSRSHSVFPLTFLSPLYLRQFVGNVHYIVLKQSQKNTHTLHSKFRFFTIFCYIEKTLSHFRLPFPQISAFHFLLSKPFKKCPNCLCLLINIWSTESNARNNCFSDSQDICFICPV